jgi:hypothetical protein
VRVDTTLAIVKLLVVVFVALPNEITRWLLLVEFTRIEVFVVMLSVVAAASVVFVVVKFLIKAEWSIMFVVVLLFVV